jgi:flagellar basal-body rod modification protein FlgD
MEGAQRNENQTPQKAKPGRKGRETVETTNITQTANLAVKGQTGPQVAGHDPYADLDLNKFIQMLIAEMQNQDPLDPMNNQEILQQVSQIRAIESNTRLTDTLQSVLLGQNVSTASSMIGKTIQGLTDDGKQVSGQVEQVSIKDGVPTLHVGEDTVSLKNVGEILPTSPST